MNLYFFTLFSLKGFFMITGAVRCYNNKRYVKIVNSMCDADVFGMPESKFFFIEYLKRTHNNIHIENIQY